MLVIGSTDYHISDVWTGHPAGTTENQFKVGCAPMSTGSDSVSQIVTGNNIANLYHDQVGGPNNDNGYGWVTDGLIRVFVLTRGLMKAGAPSGPAFRTP